MAIAGEVYAMSLCGYRVIPYRLALRRPWRTASGVCAERRGWLVSLDGSEGFSGWGDCAPMEGIGTESWRRAAALLPDSVRVLVGSGLDDAVSLLPDDAPAVHCALETALLDWYARASNSSVARLLAPEAADQVAVNASCGELDAGAILRCRAAIDRGFQVLKFKVGLSKPTTDVRRLLELAAVLPSGVALRLDANRAWSRSESHFVVHALADVPIECLEEPLRVPELDNLRELQGQAMFPLALDESLADLDMEVLLRVRPVVRFVLKPMAHGGPRSALRLARRAAAAGIESVITTSVESAVGVAACLHLAAALNNGLAHGLATSGWLKSDVAVPIPITNGRMRVPVVSGLGVEPADAKSEGCGCAHR